MKKFFIILFSLFIIKCTYSQDQKNEPSKEATMEWMADKLKDCLVSPRYFVKYQNGIFTYKNSEEKNVYVNFNKITKVWWNTDDGFLYGVHLEGKNLVTYDNGETSDSFSEREIEFFDGPIVPDQKRIKYVYNLGEVYGLRSRFFEAAVHLEYLNVGKKENEPF